MRSLLQSGVHISSLVWISWVWSRNIVFGVTRSVYSENAFRDEIASRSYPMPYNFLHLKTNYSIIQEWPQNPIQNIDVHARHDPAYL
jgi:hypothetical protein